MSFRDAPAETDRPGGPGCVRAKAAQAGSLLTEQSAGHCYVEYPHMRTIDVGLIWLAAIAGDMAYDFTVRIDFALAANGNALARTSRLFGS